MSVTIYVIELTEYVTNTPKTTFFDVKKPSIYLSANLISPQVTNYQQHTEIQKNKHFFNQRPISLKKRPYIGT